MTSSGTQLHIWHHCYNCKIAPLDGIRYHCEVCPAGPDNDLCAACYQLYLAGGIDHPSKDSFHIARDDTQQHRFIPVEGLQGERYEPWLEIQPITETPAVPEVLDGFLLRPEFCSGTYSSFGGYSFVVETGRGLLLLTALHVLDEFCKAKRIDISVSNSHYSGRELPEAISKVNLYNVLTDKWMLNLIGEAGTALELPGARGDEEEPYSYNDICAFRVPPNPALRPARLAEITPGVGSTIWLAVKTDDGSNLKEAVVVESTERSFIFRYTDPGDFPKYTSGAPFLDADGRVVAINVGAGRYNGLRFGHANHVDSIRQHLHIEKNPL